jgi:rare lipoprotein A
MAKWLIAAFAAIATVAPVQASESRMQTFVEDVQTGIASYYSRRFEGRRTASGETFRNEALTAAHASLPFGTHVLVTCLERGRSVVVRITDRLPAKRAIIDLTQEAAAQLNMLRAGLTRVTVKVLTRDEVQALRGAARTSPLALDMATESFPPR